MSRVFDALNTNTGQIKDLSSGLWNLPAPPAPKVVERPSIAIAPSPALDFQPRAEDRLVALESDNNVAAENIRILATRLKYLKQQRSFNQLLITSSVTGEGKSMLSANLAITLASREGARTLLIDGDIPSNKLTRTFQATDHPGLIDWLSQGGPVSDFSRQLPDMPLWFVPVGQQSEEFSLRTEQITESLAAIKEAFDWIIVDAPPLTFLADTSAWALALEKCLVVVRVGVTPKKLLAKGISSLPAGKMLGLVMNDCSDASHSYYARYYRKKA
jgi:capsular exopolysaccharide synthesis family protein